MSTNEVLATQIDVFEETQAEDDSHVIMPGGVDLNSHEDIFNALFIKVDHVFLVLYRDERWEVVL